MLLKASGDPNRVVDAECRDSGFPKEGLGEDIFVRLTVLQKELPMANPTATKISSGYVRGRTATVGTEDERGIEQGKRK